MNQRFLFHVNPLYTSSKLFLVYLLNNDDFPHCASPIRTILWAFLGVVGIGDELGTIFVLIDARIFFKVAILNRVKVEASVFFSFFVFLSDLKCIFNEILHVLKGVGILVMLFYYVYFPIKKNIIKNA